MAHGQELRVVIAAGGTAGHVAPALAVADALRARGATVTFAGSPGRAEARLVPAAGYELDTFAVSGLPRRPSLDLPVAVARAVAAPVACARILRRRRAHALLGGGGFVAGPAVVAARLLGIPAALTEADAHLGLANRLAAPLARRVFLAYPLPGRTGPKYRVTGRPVPATSAALPRAEARRRLGLAADGPLLLVFGGSQGARAVNEIAVDAFGATGPPVLHLCGERYYHGLRQRVTRDDYHLVPYTDEFGAALGAADLALSRAGGSVWELAAAGVPAVLVPSPNVTADHQTENARHFAAGGGAVVVPETELSRAPEVVASLLGDPARRAAMSEAMRGLARPRAADEIAEELIALAERASRPWGVAGGSGPEGTV